METRVNVVGYHIPFTKRIYLPYFRLIDFKALIKVLKGRRCLFTRKKTYFFQVLTISQGLFPINIK